MGVGHGAAGVVVGVELDVAVDVAPHQRDQLVHLARRGDADGVGDAHALGAGLVDGAVDADEVVGVGAEGVLAAEAGLEARRR